MTPPYIINSESISIVLEGKPFTVNKTHPNFDAVRDAIKVQDFDTLLELIDIPQAIVTNSSGRVKVINGEIYYGDSIIHSVLSSKILDMLREGFNVEPMLKFMDNLMANPSKQSVDELYLFLEHAKLPITEDGHFLAYKRVRNNYLDIHSGMFDNSPGQVLEMARNLVDDRRDNTCSTGFHFCSLPYLAKFNHSPDDRVVIVKINPADVVSIPYDYDNTKGRTCRYEVIGEIPLNEAEKAFESTVDTKWNVTVSDENSFEIVDEDEEPEWYDDLPPYDRVRERLVNYLIDYLEYEEDNLLFLGDDTEDDLSATAFSSIVLDTDSDTVVGMISYYEEPIAYIIRPGFKSIWTGSGILYRNLTTGRYTTFEQATQIL